MLLDPAPVLAGPNRDELIWASTLYSVRVCNYRVDKAGFATILAFGHMPRMGAENIKRLPFAPDHSQFARDCPIKYSVAKRGLRILPQSGQRQRKQLRLGICCGGTKSME
jgi:hypothetical protein